MNIPFYQEGKLRTPFSSEAQRVEVMTNPR